jgi:hypothetical protein
MPITTLKVLSTVLQLHGPGATVQSDHQGIEALLADLRGQNAVTPTEVYFRRGFCSRPRVWRLSPRRRIWIRRRIPPGRIPPVLGLFRY